MFDKLWQGNRNKRYIDVMKRENQQDGNNKQIELKRFVLLLNKISITK